MADRSSATRPRSAVDKGNELFAPSPVVSSPSSNTAFTHSTPSGAAKLASPAAFQPSPSSRYILPVSSLHPAVSACLSFCFCPPFPLPLPCNANLPAIVCRPTPSATSLVHRSRSPAPAAAAAKATNPRRNTPRPMTRIWGNRHTKPLNIGRRGGGLREETRRNIQTGEEKKADKPQSAGLDPLITFLVSTPPSRIVVSGQAGNRESQKGQKAHTTLPPTREPKRQGQTSGDKP